MKVHLDTDLGGDPDDLCALALLLARHDVELTGITTCNEHYGKRAGYVRYALRLAGRDDIPIAAGAEGGVMGLRYAGDLPNESEFWPQPIAPYPGCAGEALNLLDTSIEQGATVIALGPYTNLALYEALRPGRLAQMRVVLMGGCIGPMKAGLPQWGPHEDWNMHLDAVATRRVFECCHPLIVPMNVSLQVHLRMRDLPRLRVAGALGTLMARQAEAYERAYHHRGLGKAYTLLPDDLLNFHHDPLACTVALGWDGVTIEELPLKLEMQDSYPVLRVADDGVRLPVVTEVDGERFNQFWLDSVAPQ
jgi:inosine-uridine nucleoside N-ribohydrolase